MSVGMRPYHEMVSKLFKTEIRCSDDAEALMHAAVGISGEVAELHDADGRKNLVEELGDIKFYIVAARQQLSEDRAGAYAIQEFTFASVLPTMTVLSGNFLDLVKKQWIYGRQIDLEEAHKLLDRIECGVRFICKLTGISESEVMVTNQEKLGLRYPEGVYTDYHARERLDKHGVVEA